MESRVASLNAFSSSCTPRWARGIDIAVGAITVALSVMVLIFPGFGLFTLYVLVAAAALIVNGVYFIISGITGVIFRPVSIGFGSTRSKNS